MHIHIYMRKWYVYNLIDPRNEQVFYVGKGFGQRMFVHKCRALKWVKDNKKNKVNAKLYHKILSILAEHNDYIALKVFETFDEKEALYYETQEIACYGIENLCNLTLGGEGETKTPEVLEKMSVSIKIFWNSSAGTDMKKVFSKERQGSKNPMFGKKEDKEHKKLRMKNLLAKPRWNIGLSKETDSRIKGPPISSIPHNARYCKLRHEDGRIIEAPTIMRAAKLTGIPPLTLQKWINGNVPKKEKTRRGWSLEIDGTLF